MKRQTQAIRIQAERSQNREHAVPLYLTSSFTFEDVEQGRAIFADEQPGNIYSRYMNPNVDEFVEKMCMFEKAEDGLAFSTGMAAIFGAMAGLLKQGDHVVASSALFGSAIQILTKITAKWGIECTFVEGANISAWEQAIQPNTKFFFCESPSNPGLELIDLEALAKVKEGKDDFGFNARTETYEKMLAAGVIDPTKVSRVALENASSIAGMLLTTECVIADKPEPKSAAPAMPGGMGGGMGMDY